MSKSAENLSRQQSESSNSGSEPPKRKRGRPLGSTTKRLDVVQFVSPGCSRCGATGLRHLSTINKLQISGVQNGQEYNEISWYRKQCDVCGQIQAVKVFRMITAKTSQENT